MFCREIGQVAQDLQHRDGLGDFLVQSRVREAYLGGFLHRGMQGGEGAADVFFEGIVERDRRGQPTDLLFRDRRFAFAALDQDVLDDLDRRAQADAAGGFGQGAEQVQQDIEVGGQERIEIDKGLAVEIDAVDARID